jgi:hypothetical protein
MKRHHSDTGSSSGAAPPHEFGLDPLFWARPKLLIATIKGLNPASSVQNVRLLHGKPTLGAHIVGTIVCVEHKSGFGKLHACYYTTDSFQACLLRTASN